MAKRVPAGEMRHVIKLMEHKIETGSTAYDTYGMISASSTAWNRIAIVRAKIEELSGAKNEISRQAYPTASHMITIDYSTTLATTGGPRRAIVFNNTRWIYIRAIMNPDQENRQLQMICSESL